MKATGATYCYRFRVPSVGTACCMGTAWAAWALQGEHQWLIWSLGSSLCLWRRTLPVCVQNCPFSPLPLPPLPLPSMCSCHGPFPLQNVDIKIQDAIRGEVRMGETSGSGSHLIEIWIARWGEGWTVLRGGLAQHGRLEWAWLDVRSRDVVALNHVALHTLNPHLNDDSNSLQGKRQWVTYVQDLMGWVRRSKRDGMH